MRKSRLNKVPSHDCFPDSRSFAKVLLLATAMVGGHASAAAIHGALFTTDSVGNVNVNQYDSKAAVYLDAWTATECALHRRGTGRRHLRLPDHQSIRHRAPEFGRASPIAPSS